MEKQVGRPVKRVEDLRLVTGRGAFVSNLAFSNLHEAAILRSPHAHARIVAIDASEALKAPGVVGVLTGSDVLALTRPFAIGVQAPVKYYCMATDKARFVGEPVALVVARDRYLAEDALERIKVEYEPLPAVVDPEEALKPGAPVLHEQVGSNLVCHRLMSYGEPERAFKEADVVVRQCLRFPKVCSTPMETYGVIARHDPTSGVLTVYSNFVGPFVMHPLVAMALKIPENHLRFVIASDIGGSFGIKISIFPYLALIGLAAMKTGVPVKWIEDRREHLLASSSGTDRIAYRELAARRDGTILALRSRWFDNVGGYIRAPEPGCSFRPMSNWVGPYRVQHLEADASLVTTNKSLTGPNRGYACGHLYFELERMVDLLAERLGMDPAEVRRRNLIAPNQFPYETPTGGLYDSGDYPAAFDKALELAGYDELRKEQKRAREQGRLYGIGLALAVDPSVSNMGYVSVALDPEVRIRPGYQAKSGATETATVKIDPLGKIIAVIGSAAQGQGHQTVVAQIVADEFGVPPEEITVVDEMDTFTRSWSVSSGTYSSRFASVGTSAAVLAAQRLKAKLIRVVSALTEVPPDELTVSDGRVHGKSGQGPSMTLKDIAGQVHWNTEALPVEMDARLEAGAVFSFPQSKAPDIHDKVNCSNTYGFIAEVMAVEVDRTTAQVKILKYVTVHDAGVVINPMIAEGQILGGALHGLGAALYEDLVYNDEGDLLTATLMDYLVPTASEAPKLEIAHLQTPSPFTTLGSKGLGEASSMTAPAVVANAVSDALKPLGVEVTELPITSNRLWHLIEAAKKHSNETAEV